MKPSEMTLEQFIEAKRILDEAQKDTDDSYRLLELYGMWMISGDPRDAILNVR